MLTVNILWGQDERPDEGRMFEILVNNFRQFNLFNVGTLQAAHDKESLDREIASGKYDVVVCNESLQGTLIGAGSVRAWEDLKPGIKIILILNDDKKGKTKVFSLFTRHNYNCVFRKDFGTGESIAQMIANGRTEEQAVEYYGLKDNADYLALLERKEAAVTEDEVTVEEQAEPVIDGADAGEITEETSGYDFFNEPLPDVPDVPHLQDEINELLGESAISTPAQKQEFVTNDDILNAGKEEDTPMMPYMAEEALDDILKHEEDEKAPLTPTEPIFGSSFPSNIPTGLTKKFDPQTSSVVATEGFVVHVLSDTAIVVEVPGAHFKETMRDGTTISLITSRLDTIL